MAEIVWKDPKTEKPEEGEKIIGKFKFTPDGAEVIDEMKLERCHDNDSPFHYHFNYYFVKRNRSVAGVAESALIGWAEYFEGWDKKDETSPSS